MGKRKQNPTIGYWYSMGLYTGEVRDADVLLGIYAGGKTVWEGEMRGDGTLQINKPELFGGEKKEGGLVGTLWVRKGGQDQLPHPYLVAQVPGPWPAGRGIVTCLYDGIVGAMNPYIKPWQKCWGRWQAGWAVPVWEPGLCQIDWGMNPAHIFYDTITAAGIPPDMIDAETLLPVARRLKDEGLGLCLEWSRADSIASFLNTVCAHVGADWYEDPRTGKLGMTLHRDNYDAATLPEIDERDIIALDSWQQPMLHDSVNEVTVVGRDALTDKPISATFQNVANVQAQGRVISETRKLPGLWNHAQVAAAAQRLCIESSSLLGRIRLRIKRSRWGIKRGDVLALSWARRGVKRMPVRVLEVDEGVYTDSALTLTLMQDVHGLTTTSYLQPSLPGWVAPDDTPKPVTAQQLVEATWRDIASVMREADLQALSPQAAFIALYAARPAGPTYGYELETRPAGGDWKAHGGGDFTPTGLLLNGIDARATSLTLTSSRDLGLVRIGSELLVGSEIMRVLSVDVQTGLIGIARGCVDTVPASHAAGTRAWFGDDYSGIDGSEYLQGEQVRARARTRTAQGLLEVGLAPEASITLTGRAAKPYPPGRVRINNSTAWDALPATVTVSWAHRDRKLQGDQLIDTDAASIGPEPGTTYTVRYYQPRNTLRETRTGITTDADAPYTFPATGPARIEIEAVRDGLRSAQKHQLEVVIAP